MYHNLKSCAKCGSNEVDTITCNHCRLVFCRRCWFRYGMIDLSLDECYPDEICRSCWINPFTKQSIDLVD